MKHTPGPWSNDTIGHIRAVTGDSGEQNIAQLIAPHGMMHGEYKANGRLIAAAPELLKFVEMFAWFAVPNAEPVSYGDQLEARALLARIEGGE